MLTIPHCKESLSRAYITAVVGRARSLINWGGDFDYGVDGTVKQIVKVGSRHRESGYAFDFQAKTTVDWEVESDYIVYDLEAKNYNDLAARSASSAFPLFLILLCLPRKRSAWLKVAGNQLILRECAFYYKVDGPETQNTTSKRIRIPIGNVFRPGIVRTILSQVQSGRLLP